MGNGRFTTNLKKGNNRSILAKWILGFFLAGSPLRGHFVN